MLRDDVTSPVGFAGLLVGIAALAGSGCIGIGAFDAQRHVEREEKRFTVSGRPSLSVTTFDGTIEIRRWDSADIQVVIEKVGLDDEATAQIVVAAEQTGDRIILSATVPRERRRSFSYNLYQRANLIVSVPARSDVQARSFDGAIEVERVTGRIDLHTGDGSIRGMGLTGELRVRTGDGSIRLDDVDGGLDAHTGDGSIVASGRFTVLRVHTGDGGVTVEAQPGSVPREDWDITTGDGSVVVELPEGFSGELEARTGDGRIRMDNLMLEQDPAAAVQRPGRRNLRAQLGAGGRTVRLRTGDGSITVRRY